VSLQQYSGVVDIIGDGVTLLLLLLLTSLHPCEPTRSKFVQ